MPRVILRFNKKLTGGRYSPMGAGRYLYLMKTNLNL